MTTPTPRWTAETEELAWQTLVATGSNSWRERLDASRAARQVLIALADAGVLIPVGGETRQEWRVKVHGHPLAGAQLYQDRRGAEAYRRAIVKPTQLLTRTVHTEPWREVTDGD